MAAQPEAPRITIEVVGGELTKWNLIRQGERTQKKIEEIIDTYSFMIQREAMLRCPVDTGFLRSSIIVDEIDPYYNEVVAATDYAHFVEFGTSQHPAQPFMVPAAQMHIEGFKKEIQKALRWGWAT